MATQNGSAKSYSTTAEARKIFKQLLNDPKLNLPASVKGLYSSINIHGNEGLPVIPSPWRETEAITALKALEAAMAMALAKVRYGFDQTADIDAQHATIFLFMSYLSTIDGFGKWDKRSVAKLKPTDIRQGQSNLYRRLSANIYKTKVPGEYYHTHGSLESTPILNFLQLPGFQDRLEDYDEICQIIQEQT